MIIVIIIGIGLIIVSLIVVTLIFGGGAIMSKNLNLRSLYLYLVCLVTLIIFIFGLINVVQNTVDLALGGSHYYSTMYEFEQRFYTYGPDGKKGEVTLSQEEIEKRYEEYLIQEKQRAKVNNIRQLASSISAMIVGGGFWIYHWRKIKDVDQAA